jgi:hypothetical protein
MGLLLGVRHPAAWRGAAFPVWPADAGLMSAQRRTDGVCDTSPAAAGQMNEIDALNGNTRPWIVAVCNQKGGVGKTTTALNLASVFADSSGRVQVVDPDLAGMGSSMMTGRPADRGSGSGVWVRWTVVAAWWRGFGQLWPEGRMFWLSWNRLAGS